MAKKRKLVIPKKLIPINVLASPVGTFTEVYSQTIPESEVPDYVKDQAKIHPTTDESSVVEEQTNTNNTQEEETMNNFEQILAGVLTAELTGKGVNKPMDKVKALDVKGFFLSLKLKALRAVYVVKEASVSLYDKSKAFIQTKTGRRVAKLGLAMGAVAVGGAMTSSMWTAGLAAWSIFGMVRGIHAIYNGTAFTWTWKDAIVNNLKDLAYVGTALFGYVFASPYLMDWFLTATVWVLNSFINIWASLGLVIVG